MQDLIQDPQKRLLIFEHTLSLSLSQSDSHTQKKVAKNNFCRALPKIPRSVSGNSLILLSLLFSVVHSAPLLKNVENKHI